VEIFWQFRGSLAFFYYEYFCAGRVKNVYIEKGT